jgi:hypothetical protein
MKVLFGATPVTLDAKDVGIPSVRVPVARVQYHAISLSSEKEVCKFFTQKFKK